LGLPLTAASVGTVATLFVGKKFHAGFGIAWTILSVLHGIQHKKKMKNDASRIFSCEETKCNEKEISIENFLKSIKVSSYMMGRVRVYSNMLINNANLCRQLEEYICSFQGVLSAKANEVTGSILITYDAVELRKNPKLKAIEDYCAGKIC